MAGSMRGRDNHTCQACGKEHEEGSSFPVHHIRPERLGGPDEPWNLVTLCPPCHNRGDAQDGDYKIPQSPKGESIRDIDDMKERWEEFKKREAEKSLDNITMSI
jgi:5-methylcytosine-specific restriction endonuclease McrA